ncbi:hypothetical protein CIRG_09880 [Coccidioides immitis RMSCC 2394]|uniref:Uncharacterized protein n=1 Tax=Coccidioides immitis RMSCC 2394 TaxID=404692 RepID=A0A0J6YSD3_COCIT|nr:hypothetical protein CIRG_09880 [Coccidioides immitis RMSCC 2394]
MDYEDCWSSQDGFEDGEPCTEALRATEIRSLEVVGAVLATVSTGAGIAAAYYARRQAQQNNRPSGARDIENLDSPSRMGILRSPSARDARSPIRSGTNTTSLCTTSPFERKHTVERSNAARNRRNIYYSLVMAAREVLCLAAEEGLEHIIRLPPEIGVNINGSGGCSAVCAAAKNGHKNVLELLVRRKFDSNAGNVGAVTPAKVEEACTHAVQLLLEKGEIICDKRHHTALCAASRKGREDMVRLLLDHGSNINAESRSCGSALYEAAKEGHVSLVHFLLSNGASVNGKGAFYNTPLGAAARYGHVRIVCSLLESGADVNRRSYIWGTPLYAAARWGHDEVVSVLLQKGADVKGDGDGFDHDNALFAAVGRCRERIVQLLLEYGADVNAKGLFNETPLQATAKRGNRNLVRLLLQNRAHAEGMGQVIELLSETDEVETL